MYSIRNLRSLVPCEQHQSAEQGLIKWANDHLPSTPIRDIGDSCAPDSVLSRGPEHETLEGLLTLVDFLLGEGPNSGAINIRSKRDKVIQMLRALHAWERHRAVLQPTGMDTLQGGPSQSITRV